MNIFLLAKSAVPIGAESTSPLYALGFLVLATGVLDMLLFFLRIQKYKISVELTFCQVLKKQFSAEALALSNHNNRFPR